MSKFKPGDKVKFVGNVNGHMYSDKLNLYKNNLTIISVSGANGKEDIKIANGEDILNTKWFCKPDDLELVEENTENFDIGETVKIRDGLEDGKHYGCLCCYFHLSEHCGKTGVISAISKNGNYKIFGKWFSKEMLERVDDNILKNESRKIMIDDLNTASEQVKHNQELYKKYIKGLYDNCDELCEYCKYDGQCNGLTNHGNGPVYPPCADYELEEYIDYDNLYAKVDIKTIEDYLKNKEEEKMENKVLDLWYTRKKENIYKEYKDLEDKYVKEHYEVVKQYNELIQKFENDLEEFCTKYSDITVGEDFVICKDNDCNIYKYVIDEDVIRNDAKSTYKSEKNEKYKKLQETYEDISALLSMSDNLEYQQSILIEYGIIDKKTKRMIVDEDNFK